AIFAVIGIIAGIMPFVCVFVGIVAVALIRRPVVPVRGFAVGGVISHAVVQVARWRRRVFRLAAETRSAQRRSWIDFGNWLVSLVRGRAGVVINVQSVRISLGREISLAGRVRNDLVRRRVGGAALGLVWSVIRMHWRSRSAIAAPSVHRHALTDQPRQLGKRIVSRRRLLCAAPT